MEKQLTTITVLMKDKKKFKGLANKYDLNQQELFGRMMKVIKKYDPEMREGK